MSRFRSSLRLVSVLSGFVFALSVAAQAQSTPEGITKQWMDAFNAGDMAKTATFNSPSGGAIIDEFAPYTWSGPNAFAEWGAGFDSYSKARGITEPKVTLGTLVVRSVTPAEAYLIYPGVYTYKQKGAAMRENGRVAVVLRKEGGAWKIASWAWAGGVPAAAK